MTGDSVRFSLLWGESHLALRSYVHSLVGEPAAVDDLVQEVALAAFQSFASYDPARSFTAWVLGIARHLVLHHWKDRARHGAMIRDPEQLAELAEHIEAVDEDGQRRREALRACIASTAGRSWEIIQAFYIDDEPVAGIAERLRLRAGHVRVLLFRVRDALRRCVERRLRAGVADA